MTEPDPDRARTGVADEDYMGFVGVTTGSSSIMTVFPRWAELLGLPTRRLVGHDVALGAEPEVYRQLVDRIAADPAHRGALVTTHKLGVFEAAHDRFDKLDELAQTFGEVSSIYKRDGRLCGAARDPLTVRLALEEFLPNEHFGRTGGEVLCLGDGGAAAALTHQLGVRADRPGRISVAGRSAARLDHLRSLHERAGIAADRFDYQLVGSAGDADRLLHRLPPSSLVVNATGMGKDVPGSPLTDAAVFPEHGVVWEFNYRGTLEFWQQARAQRQQRTLVLEDGWRYFVHGWSQVVGDVFDRPMPPETVAELSRVAAETRGPRPS